MYMKLQWCDSQEILLLYDSIIEIISEMAPCVLQFHCFTKLERTHLSGLMILVGIVLKSYLKIYKCLRLSRLVILE